MIFSLQSNVLHGTVGNRASLPLYHAFGLECTHLDTVRLAAHPGHGTTIKDVTDATMMGDLFADYLRLPARTPLTAIHSGYFGNAAQITQCASFIRQLRAINPQLIYLLDPVFGDAGKAYVSDEIITATIKHLLPLATIITPNQFELEQLCGHPIASTAQASNALASLPNCHADMRLLTGLLNTPSITDLLYHQGAITSHHAPALSQGVSGGGDAFAALMLAGLHHNLPAPDALHQAATITHHMITHSKSPLTLDMASGLDYIQKYVQL